MACTLVSTVKPRPPTRYSFTWTTRTALEYCAASAVAKLRAASLDAESSMASRILGTWWGRTSPSPLATALHCFHQVNTQIMR